MQRVHRCTKDIDPSAKINFRCFGMSCSKGILQSIIITVGKMARHFKRSPNFSWSSTVGVCCIPPYAGNEKQLVCSLLNDQRNSDNPRSHANQMARRFFRLICKWFMNVSVSLNRAVDVDVCLESLLVHCVLLSN